MQLPHCWPAPVALHTEATVSAPLATASATWRSPTTAQWQKITVSLHGCWVGNRASAIGKACLSVPRRAGLGHPDRDMSWITFWITFWIIFWVTLLG